MSLPPELTTVTRTSKLLALALFVSLPFIGFYVGYQFGTTHAFDAFLTSANQAPQATSTAATTTAATTTAPVKAPVVQKAAPKPVVKTAPKATTPTTPTTYTPPKTSTSQCYVTNCHGPITCSTQPSTLMCTADYQLGDFCRQYQHCVALNNSCQVVKDSRYNQCLGCVQQCSSLYSNDPQRASSCENTCRTTLQGQ